jgi:hypothetical protein
MTDVKHAKAGLHVTLKPNESLEIGEGASAVVIKAVRRARIVVSAPAGVRFFVVRLDAPEGGPDDNDQG